MATPRRPAQCGAPADESPRFPASAPGWSCTSAEETPPAPCSDPAVSSRARRRAADLAGKRTTRKTPRHHFTEPGPSARADGPPPSRIPVEGRRHGTERSSAGARSPGPRRQRAPDTPQLCGTARARRLHGHALRLGPSGTVTEVTLTC